MAVVKICGLKTQEDVGLMNEYLPEYVGFVFASSKRQVNDEQAKRMKEQLNPRIQTVGVFVNEPQEHIVSLCKQGILDVVQLHGEENNQYIKELREKYCVTEQKEITKEQEDFCKIFIKETHTNSLKNTLSYMIPYFFKNFYNNLISFVNFKNKINLL